MSQLTPTPANLRSGAPFRSPIPLWQIAGLSALLLWLYWPTLVRLFVQLQDADFSHGFIVPFFSAYVIWQNRRRFAALPARPSWSGLIVLMLAMGVLIFGRMGAELFLARFSILLVLAGLVILFLGWNFLRAAFFPWAFLLLAIPIPALILGQVTFPLQLLVSRLSAGFLELLRVPVQLQGNILRLAALPLDVAAACSGIRSLISLLALAIIYGYLMEKRLWVRWLLALSSVPIAVASNTVRIVGTALIVQYWDVDKAEGPFHTFWGMMVYVVSLVLLYALHALIRAFWPDKNGEGTTPAETRLTQRVSTSPALRFALAAILIAVPAVFLFARGRNELVPHRLALESFPEQLGSWSGTDLVIANDQLAVLGAGDFLLRDYRSDSEPSGVNLFIAYFPTQRTNDTPHSPQHCLPGSGWTPIENKRILLRMPGHAPFRANRYVIAQGDARRLVLYWFWAHDRGIASEYWFKYYLVHDSLQLHRSDGALIRLTVPVLPDETIEEAQQRLLAFGDNVLPLLNAYIPK